MLNENFVYLGIAINFFGSVSYIIDTYHGKVAPNRVSFLLWSFIPLISFFAMRSEGIGISSYLTLSTGLIPLLIFITSFLNPKAYWSLSVFDYFCGFISILGIILWLIFQSGNIAIFASIVADGFAAIPTLKKSYTNPETESAIPYFATVLAIILTLFTLKEFTFTSSGFITYILIVNTMISSLVYFKLGEKITKFVKN